MEGFQYCCLIRVSSWILNRKKKETEQCDSKTIVIAAAASHDSGPPHRLSACLSPFISHHNVPFSPKSFSPILTLSPPFTSYILFHTFFSTLSLSLCRTFFHTSLFLKPRRQCAMTLNFLSGTLCLLIRQKCVDDAKQTTFFFFFFTLKVKCIACPTSFTSVNHTPPPSLVKYLDELSTLKWQVS